MSDPFLTQKGKSEKDLPSIIPKRHDPDGMIRFRLGPIEGRPDLSLRKDGSVVNSHPRVLNKKERKRDRAAQAKYKEGYRFQCTCKAITFHFPSHTRIKPKGYQSLQRVETYVCSACGEHFDRDRIDAAVAAHKSREETKTQSELTSLHDAQA